MFKVKGWTFDEDTDSAVCQHGNTVEVDGTCYEADCSNPYWGAF